MLGMYDICGWKPNYCQALLFFMKTACHKASFHTSLLKSMADKCCAKTIFTSGEKSVLERREDTHGSKIDKTSTF